MLAFVLPSEVAALPYVGEPFTTGDLADALFKRIDVTGRVSLVGSLLPQETAKINEIARPALKTGRPVTG